MCKRDMSVYCVTSRLRHPVYCVFLCQHTLAFCDAVYWVAETQQGALYIYMYIYIYVRIYMYMSEYICICTIGCIIYIYVYIYIYVSIYMYM